MAALKVLASELAKPIAAEPSETPARKRLYAVQQAAESLGYGEQQVRNLAATGSQDSFGSTEGCAWT